jgi:hypothetical protein
MASDKETYMSPVCFSEASMVREQTATPPPVSDNSTSIDEEATTANSHAHIRFARHPIGTHLAEAYMAGRRPNSAEEANLGSRLK